MGENDPKGRGSRFPILQGVLPIRGSQLPTEVVAGITLAALAIPEVMGYTEIAGTPVITGLYTILIPMACMPCLDRPGIWWWGLTLQPRPCWHRVSPGSLSLGPPTTWPWPACQQLWPEFCSLLHVSLV